jgi:hypothetical protein
MKRMRIAVLSCLVASFVPVATLCQPSAITETQPDERKITGKIASSTANTMVVKTEGGRYLLFVLERSTVRPRVLTAGTGVTVTSHPGDEPGVRIASLVAVQNIAQTTKVPDSAQPGTDTSVSEEPIPPEVRRIERQINRQVRKYNVGVRAGAALDPEIIFGGVHARFGPIFHPDVFFRPNAEIGFGEVTTQIGLNLEVIYRLPLNVRSGRWSAYFGAGPGFAFSHRNFTEAQSGDRNIDFGEFDWHTGLNVLTGLEYRNGMFIEFKATAYATPHFRMMIGYSF